jgi:hypothetical protein
MCGLIRSLDQAKANCVDGKLYADLPLFLVHGDQRLCKQRSIAQIRRQTKECSMYNAERAYNIFTSQHKVCSLLKHQNRSAVRISPIPSSSVGTGDGG